MDVLRGIYLTWKKLTRGWLGYVVYALLGILFALFVNQALAFALDTDLPVVAVMSSSMQHDNPEITHYGWLETNLNYSRSYIDSWPFSKGFSVGDMPIVRKYKSYKVGEIIVFSVKGQPAPIIHRIIKVNEDGSYQTKGDNVAFQHPYEKSVKIEQIHGKVIFIIPKLGYFKVLISKIFGVY